METEKPTNYEISFAEILNRAQLERETDPSITQTAKYMISASYFEENSDILKVARDALVKEDPRRLVMDCLRYLVKMIQTSDSGRRYMWVDRFESLGIRGLGLRIDDLSFIGSQTKNIFSGEPKWERIEKHVNETVLGKTFIEKVSVPPDHNLWNMEVPLRISSCDASQHRFKLSLPFYNKSFTTPIVINNAAGIIKEKNGDNSEWMRVAVPKNTQDFESWVVVGFDDFKNLANDDYEWATKSAMDVGQYYVEESFIFTHGGASKRPDLHFRDGTIFPQDHAMNCRLVNRHGILTREAILRMTTTLQRAKDLGILFCGVSKTVHMTIYSVIVDYYIKEVMGDEKWNLADALLPDSDIMRYMLYNEKFDASTFSAIYLTCPIVRSFYVKSNLNSRTDKQAQNDLKSLEEVMHTRTMSARQIVERALDTKIVMFFAGHFKSDEFYIPRYEFVYDGDKSKVEDVVARILSAVRLATIELDQDHQRTLDQPILIPLPLLYAHDLSKAMGEELVNSWVSRVWAEYIQMKSKL